MKFSIVMWVRFAVIFASNFRRIGNHMVRKRCEWEGYEQLPVANDCVQDDRKCYLASLV